MASTGIYPRSIQGSPSVSLEKGAYRMHAAHTRRPSSKSRPGHSTRGSISTYEKRLGFLVFLLVMATVSCFGTAYYLFKTRCARRISHIQETSSDADLEQLTEVVEFEQDGLIQLPTSYHGAKYLSYLPHSGFHNQRIAFENALVLARILNRTLLVPPVWLGKAAIPYDSYDNLQQMLVQSEKQDLSHCAGQPTGSSECAEIHNYTLVTWDWLINFDLLKTQQRLVQRWDMSEDWIKTQLNLSTDQILTLKDSNPYHFRIVDLFPENLKDLGLRYRESITVARLHRVPQHLLQFGTLFGSSRLRLRNRENIAIRKKVRESMVFSNPLLLNISESIRNRLGGDYIGAHVRLGDGRFLEHGDENVRVIWWRLVHQTFMLNVDDALELEARVTGKSHLEPPELKEDIAARRYPKPPIERLPEFLQLPGLKCQTPLHTTHRFRPLNAPLFISTDVSDPSSHPSLSLFYKTFPCTFTLFDFMDEFKALDRLQSGYDHLKLTEFALPFLDAMVAGKANEVVGTEDSTFSRFVEDVLWRQYHGLEIVQRG